MKSAHLKSKGFSLLELLVVISILGILASGIFALIDPIEQLRKRNDIKKQESASELYTALNKYFSSKGTFPWESGSSDCALQAPNGNIAPGTMVSSLNSCIKELITSHDLSADFATPLAQRDMYIVEPYKISPTLNASNGEMAICFLPESKSEKIVANTKYTQEGIVDYKNCPGVLDPTIKCYWCITDQK